MAPPPAPLAALLAAPLAALLAAPLAVLLAAPPPAWHPQGGRSSLPGQSNVRDFSVHFILCCVAILEIGFLASSVNFENTLANILIFTVYRYGSTFLSYVIFGSEWECWKV